VPGVVTLRNFLIDSIRVFNLFSLFSLRFFYPLNCAKSIKRLSASPSFLCISLNCVYQKDEKNQSSLNQLSKSAGLLDGRLAFSLLAQAMHAYVDCLRVEALGRSQSSSGRLTASFFKGTDHPSACNKYETTCCNHARTVR